MLVPCWHFITRQILAPYTAFAKFTQLKHISVLNSLFDGKGETMMLDALRSNVFDGTDPLDRGYAWYTASVGKKYREAEAFLRKLALGSTAIKEISVVRGFLGDRKLLKGQAKREQTLRRREAQKLNLSVTKPRLRFSKVVWDWDDVALNWTDEPQGTIEYVNLNKD